MSQESSKSSLLKPSFESTKPSISSPTRWIELCERSETLADGLYPYEVRKGEYDHPILLIRLNGALYALHDECPHRRIQISESGYIDGDVVYCGWHHWGFKIESGAHIVPTGICVARYEVKEDHDKVFIGVTW
jgi:nitrite reductase/ring-hydroxylating ferredoxin subunit